MPSYARLLLVVFHCFIMRISSRQQVERFHLMTDFFQLFIAAATTRRLRHAFAALSILRLTRRPRSHLEPKITAERHSRDARSCSSASSQCGTIVRFAHKTSSPSSLAIKCALGKTPPRAMMSDSGGSRFLLRQPANELLLLIITTLNRGRKWSGTREQCAFVGAVQTNIRLDDCLVHRRVISTALQFHVHWGLA